MRGAFLLVLCCWGTACCYGQDTGFGDLDRVLQRLDVHQREAPQEKVYLHLDKPYYAVGDDIWFKAYATLGSFPVLSDWSGVLYVDLIGPDQQLKRALCLPLAGGMTVADFKLADSLAEGNYRLRAYTNWMRNFDEDLFFDKVIMVGNTLTDDLLSNTSFSFAATADSREVLANIQLMDRESRPLAANDVRYEVMLDDGSELLKGRLSTDADGMLKVAVKKAITKPAYSFIRLTIKRGDNGFVRKVIPVKDGLPAPTVHFFPESGTLVGGVLNKLGVKVVGTDGRGMDAAGEIIDDAGVQVASFQTGYAGMGNVVFQPEANRHYQARMRLADSTEQLLALPAVQSAGYVLAVNNALAGSVYMQVRTAGENVKGQALSLIAQKDGQVFYAVKLKQTRPEMNLTLDRAKLPPGVLQLTLFDERMRPQAERLFFNLNEQDTLKMGVQFDKEFYAAKEKVSVKLKVSSTADSSLSGSFSVAITDRNKVPVDEDTDEGLLASLLLSAEIKGYIENPGYYLHMSDGKRKEHLDNLLLTQGWRRIVWDGLLSAKAAPLPFVPERALSLSGKVQSVTGKPEPAAKVSLFSSSNPLLTVDTVTGKDGLFRFDKLVFYDSTDFVVQARNAKDKKTVEIKLDTFVSQSIDPNRNKPDVRADVNRLLLGYLEKADEQFNDWVDAGLMEKSNLLDVVHVTAKQKPKLTRSSNLNGPGVADQVLVGEEFLGCPTLDICLQGKLSGVMFRDGMPFSTRSPGAPMLVIVDGVIFESSDFFTINPFDVESVEVLRNAGTTSIYGTRGANGVLIIMTKTGNGGTGRGPVYVLGVATQTPPGFYAARKFTAPDYAAPLPNTGAKDLRTTILWKPDLTTDAQGNASFEFYTAGSPGIYRMVIEGIDENGRLGRSVSYLEVK